MTKARQSHPNVFDLPINTFVSSLSSLSLALPDHMAVTLILGHELNVCSWPQNRPYLSVTKLPDGGGVISLGHHSEVKIIKLTSRHQIPQITGWSEPRTLQGIRLTGWNKRFDRGTSKAGLTRMITEALNDLALTYFLHDASSQRIWMTEYDVLVASAFGRSELTRCKVLSHLPSGSHDSLPALSTLLERDSSSEYALSEYAQPEPHVIGGGRRLYCATNHRGRPTQLFSAELDHFGQHKNLRFWNGAAYVPVVGETLEYSPFIKRLGLIPTELAVQHWGQKILNFERR